MASSVSEPSASASSANAKELSAPPSSRILSTQPAIVDDILQKYAHDSRVWYNLAVGAPFFGMSPSALRAAQGALSADNLRERICKYGDVMGDEALRTRWLSALEHNSSEAAITIAAGSNQGFVSVLCAITSPGDRVLLPVPYYFSHRAAVTLVGAQPVTVACENTTLLPTIEGVSAAIDSSDERSGAARVRALVIASPGNPSGVVYPESLLKQLIDLCKLRGIWLVIDEAYRDLMYTSKKIPLLRVNSTTPVIKLLTMSKAHGLAGWRVGAILHPHALTEALRRAQDTVPTHACRLSQVVAHAALEDDPRKALVEGGRSRLDMLRFSRDVFLEKLREVYKESTLEKKFVVPDGAFYFFLPLGNVEEDVIEFFVREARALVVPGSAFGMPDYIRVAYGPLNPFFDANDSAAALAAALKKWFRKTGALKTPNS